MAKASLKKILNILNILNIKMKMVMYKEATSPNKISTMIMNQAKIIRLPIDQMVR